VSLTDDEDAARTRRRCVLRPHPCDREEYAAEFQTNVGRVTVAELNRTAGPSHEEGDNDSVDPATDDPATDSELDTDSCDSPSRRPGESQEEEEEEEEESKGDGQAESSGTAVDCIVNNGPNHDDDVVGVDDGADVDEEDSHSTDENGYDPFHDDNTNQEQGYEDIFRITQSNVGSPNTRLGTSEEDIFHSPSAGRSSDWEPDRQRQDGAIPDEPEKPSEGLVVPPCNDSLVSQGSQNVGGIPKSTPNPPRQVLPSPPKLNRRTLPSNMRPSVDGKQQATPKEGDAEDDVGTPAYLSQEVGYTETAMMTPTRPIHFQSDFERNMLDLGSISRSRYNAFLKSIPSTKCRGFPDDPEKLFFPNLPWSVKADKVVRIKFDDT